MLFLKKIFHFRVMKYSPCALQIKCFQFKQSFCSTAVQIQNTPLVKFTRNYIRDPSGVFSVSSQVSQGRILMTSFPALSQSFVQTVGKIHIFAPPCNILYVSSLAPSSSKRTKIPGLLTSQSAFDKLH